MFALDCFDLYLDGVPFTVRTDLQAVTGLKRLKAPAGQLTYWSLTLQRYHYTADYPRGSTNQAADTLSRAPLLPKWGEKVPPAQREGERLTSHPLECENGSSPPCAAAVTSVAAGRLLVTWGMVVTKGGWLEGHRQNAFCEPVVQKLTGIAADTGNAGRRDDGNAN